MIRKIVIVVALLLIAGCLPTSQQEPHILTNRIIPAVNKEVVEAEEIDKKEQEIKRLRVELAKLGKMVLSFIYEDLDRAEERQGVLEKWVEIYGNEE